MDVEKYYTRKEAAAYLAEGGLRVAPGTLQKWATTGGGPIYQIFGNRALYTAANLDQWAKSKFSTPRSSTSEAA